MTFSHRQIQIKEIITLTPNRLVLLTVYPQMLCYPVIYSIWRKQYSLKLLWRFNAQFRNVFNSNNINI